MSLKEREREIVCACARVGACVFLCVCVCVHFSLCNQQVTGWGYDENGQITEELKMAKMPVVPQQVCLWSNRDFYPHFTSDMTYCAGFRNGMHKFIHSWRYWLLGKTRNICFSLELQNIPPHILGLLRKIKIKFYVVVIFICES
jgi:hypothetical protein